MQFLLAWHIIWHDQLTNVFSSSSSVNLDLALIGYVKSESDFETIRKQGIYYIRGGNRPGAMQYGQVTRPFKCLLLHQNNIREQILLLNF